MVRVGRVGRRPRPGGRLPSSSAPPRRTLADSYRPTAVRPSAVTGTLAGSVPPSSCRHTLSRWKPPVVPPQPLLARPLASAVAPLGTSERLLTERELVKKKKNNCRVISHAIGAPGDLTRESSPPASV